MKRRGIRFTLEWQRGQAGGHRRFSGEIWAAPSIGEECGPYCDELEIMTERLLREVTIPADSMPDRIGVRRRQSKS